MVKRIMEGRSEFIKSALMKYIMQNYCHDFSKEKYIQSKIEKAVEDIASVLTSVDR